MLSLDFKQVTAQATEAFKEVSLPSMGMEATQSDFFKIKGLTPFPSLPMTTTKGTLKSN